MGKHGRKYNNYSDFELTSRLLSAYSTSTAAIIGVYFAIVSYLLYGSIFGVVIFGAMACMMIWDSINRYLTDWNYLEENEYNINDVMPGFPYVVLSMIFNFILLIFFIVQFIEELSNMYIDQTQAIHMVALTVFIIILVIMFITNIVNMVQYDMIYDDREWEEVDYYGTDEEEDVEEGDEVQESGETCGGSEGVGHCKSCGCSHIHADVDSDPDDE